MSDLKVGEVDLERGFLWLSPSKGRDLKNENGRRRIPLSTALKMTLPMCVEGRSPDERVFPSPFLSSHVDVIDRAVGLHLSGRQCRRTFATALIAEDLPTRIVIMVMGHSSEKVTKRHYWGRTAPEIPGLEIDRFWDLMERRRGYDTRGVFEKDAS
jgi:integrase